MSYLLGLTGSIGMGKSTTAGLFAERGLPVWDADAAVHRLYAKDGAGTAALRDIAPAAIKETGVDRQVLKALISEDGSVLKKIEGVVHPLVAQDRARFIETKAADILVFDIPLLFELGSETGFDGVAVVSTSAELQRERVLSRPGMTEETFAFILSKQMADEEKRKRATFIIDTTSHETARADVDMTLSAIRERLSDA